MHPKNGIVERVRYGLTGRPETFPAADVDFIGTVEKEDEGRFQAALAAFATSSANYDPRADLNHDGSIDSTDESRFYESFDRYVGLTGNWKLSQGDGLIPGNAPGDGGYDNRFGWRGYWYDSHLQKYHVRHRVYDPREGRWMQNDPLGFGAGDQDLYRYCGGEYSMGYDPEGLAPWWMYMLPHVGITYDFVHSEGLFKATGSTNLAIDHALQDLGGRALGLSRMAGGVLLAITTAPTGIGVFVGIDQAYAGFRQLIAADPTVAQGSVLHGVLESGLEATGGFSDPGRVADQLEFFINALMGGGRPSRSPVPNSQPRVVPDDCQPNNRPRLPSPSRPSPARSELDIIDDLDLDPQQSFRGGRPTKYGDAGSVRPDGSNLQYNTHVEVKNYDLTTVGNRARMYNTIRDQAIRRASELPSGSHQGVVVDIRGQNIDIALLRRIQTNIERATGGIIPRTSVVFKTGNGPSDYLINP